MAHSRAEFLADVTRLLQVDLGIADSLASHAKSLALAPTAKRARPGLAYEFGRIAGADTNLLVDPAVMIELIHTASLVHDDIIDTANTRRGEASVNAAVGNATAVLVGDDVLVRAFLRVADRPVLLRHGLETLSDMVHAVAAEVGARGDVSLTPERWWPIARGKTAVLFALCGRFAGLSADDAVAADDLAQAGLHLGIAFQAADDVMDLASGDDLIERNPNLALVHAIAASPAIALEVAAAWARGHITPAERASIWRAVVASEALARCRATIDTELAAARAILVTRATTPAARDALATIDSWTMALAAATHHAVKTAQRDEAA